MRARTSKRRQKTSTARPHYFWDKFDEGLDEEIALAVINLEAAVGDDGEEGTISSLTDASLASIDREGLDKPENAVGLLRMSTFECTLNAAEGLYKDADQDDILRPTTPMSGPTPLRWRTTTHGPSPPSPSINR